ncbi:hypothetical protein HD806DRAFT_541376 [Xylariaceae sp. AK1471]|nr:hypothetical protein HD806DRAFT_541376 [Xylariaceae sp. AK1471]
MPPSESDPLLPLTAEDSKKESTLPQPKSSSAGIEPPFPTFRTTIYNIIFLMGLHKVCMIVGLAPGAVACLINMSFGWVKCMEVVQPITRPTSWGLWILSISFLLRSLYRDGYITDVFGIGAVVVCGLLGWYAMVLEF